MILPSEPGLQRRLAYAHYIRNRHRLRYNTNHNTSHNTNYNRNTHNFSFLSSVHIYPSEINTVNKPGLSIEKLRSVSRINIDIDSFFCPICQDTNHIPTHTDKIITRTLACHHTFHITCIETWLSEHTTCPMCRLDLDTI